MTTWDEIQAKMKLQDARTKPRTSQQIAKQFRYQNRRMWEHEKALDPLRFHLVSDIFNLNRIVRGVKTQAQIELEREHRKQGWQYPKRQEAYQDFDQEFFVSPVKSETS